MLYGINQLCAPSFPIWWVKTEYGSSDQLRLTPVAPLINVYGFPFLAFSDLIYHLEDTEVGVFWLHCAGLIVMIAFPSAAENNGVVLGAMSCNGSVSLHLCIVV